MIENAQKNNLISTSLDNKDGFVHLSNTKHLAVTLALHFSDQDRVALLQIDVESVRETLVYEKTKHQNYTNKIEVNSLKVIDIVNI